MQISRFFSLLVGFMLLCTCTSIVMCANTNNQLITELIASDNDSVFRFLYLYDSNGNKVVETKYYRENDTWKRKSQIEWMYLNNKCSSQRESVWINSKWTPSYSINYQTVGDVFNEIHVTYNNSDSVLIRKIEMEYVATKLEQKREFERKNNSWALSSWSTFTYNSKNTTDSVFVYVYDDGQVLTSYLSTYFYNSQDRLTGLLSEMQVGDNEWVKTDSTSFFYVDNKDLLLSQRSKKWNSLYNSWENDQKTDYLYNSSDKVISETSQRWNTVCWVNMVSYDFSYDGDTKRTKKTLSLPIYQVWRKLVSIDYSDFSDIYARTIESKFEFWGGNTGELTSSFIPFDFNGEPTIRKAKKISLSYLPVTDTNTSVELLNFKRDFPVYPNPSSGVYYLNTQAYSILSWSIVDLNGRLVKKQEQMSKSGIIDITELRNGIYILKINTTHEPIIQKIIKE